jgi:hypothetical protein
MRHRLAAILRSEFESGRALKIHIATDDELKGFDPPKLEECHDNAAAWVALHPSYSIVEGWVPLDTEMFARHSAVAELGRMPICVSYGRRGEVGERDFIVHQVSWTAEPFSSLPAIVSPPVNLQDWMAAGPTASDDFSN